MTVRGAAMGSEGKQHYGTQEDPLPVTTQFINGRGPNEVCGHHRRSSISKDWRTGQRVAHAPTFLQRLPRRA